MKQAALFSPVLVTGRITLCLALPSALLSGFFKFLGVWLDQKLYEIYGTYSAVWQVGVGVAQSYTYRSRKEYSSVKSKT